MKLIILLSVVALAAAAPADVQLLWSEYVNDGSGNYYFDFEQSDGTKYGSQGVLKNKGREDEFLAVEGSYEWVGPDGVRYVVTYTADDNGYRPEIEQIQPGQPSVPEQPIQPGYPAPPATYPPLLIASLLGNNG